MAPLLLGRVAGLAARWAPAGYVAAMENGRLCRVAAVTLTLVAVAASSAEKPLPEGRDFGAGLTLVRTTPLREIVAAPERYAEALARPHAREMDFTGKPLTGFVYVASDGFE